jgi:hypothetical protein
MLDCVFLVPIDHRGIQGKLFPQYLELQSWCDKNNSAILTVSGLFLNFARNYLATGGGGLNDPKPPEAKWLFWIDSDIDFTIEQVETLLAVPEEHKFCNGWYRSDYSDNAMCGMWDEDFFDKNSYMPFLSAKELTEIAKEDPHAMIQVDFTGFGFTRLASSIIEQMEYPYFTLNVHDLKKGKEMSFDDISFCQNCEKETGIKPWVIPSLRVGHLKSFFV